MWHDIGFVHIPRSFVIIYSPAPKTEFDSSASALYDALKKLIYTLKLKVHFKSRAFCKIFSEELENGLYRG